MDFSMKTLGSLPFFHSTPRHATRRDAVPHGARQAITAKVGSSWSFTQDGPIYYTYIYIDIDIDTDIDKDRQIDLIILD